MKGRQAALLCGCRGRFPVHGEIDNTPLAGPAGGTRGLTSCR